MSQGDGPDLPVGMTGTRFGGRSRHRAEGDAGPAPEQDVDADALTEPLPVVAPVEQYDLYTHDRDAEADEDDEGADGYDDGEDDDVAHIAVRPYVLTGGRTRPAVDLAIEALVSVAGPPGTSYLLDRRPDHAAVLQLCDTPRSVAEIAALLHVALGVARVLVGDLAESGAVVVHRTSGAAGPDIALLERVLGGLKRL